MKINNEQVQINEIANKINEDLDEAKSIAKLIQNPNNPKQARLYIDDTWFMSWYNLEATIAEQMKLLNSIEANIIIAMEHEAWENENEWTTSKMQYYYLQYDKSTDKWYEHESETYKAFVTLQYENIVREQIPAAKPKNQKIAEELEVCKQELDLYRNLVIEKNELMGIGNAAMLDELLENIRHWLISIYVDFNREFEAGKMKQMDWEVCEEVYKEIKRRNFKLGFYDSEKLFNQLAEVYRLY